MGLFSKIFGGKKEVESADPPGKYLPDIQIPVDEKFTINFKKNGGKFLYCESFEEVIQVLQKIISENNWQGKYFCTLDPQIISKFKGMNIEFIDKPSKSEIFLTTCENLVAKDGSILVCSRQIMDKKTNELPQNFIVFATTSQLIPMIGDALKVIKEKYKDQIPDNITTLKNFLSTQENKEDFMSYGSTTKNVYLLLLEDF